MTPSNPSGGPSANPSDLTLNDVNGIVDPITGLPLGNANTNLSNLLGQAYSSSMNLNNLFTQMAESPIAMLGLGLIVASVFIPDLFGGTGKRK